MPDASHECLLSLGSNIEPRRHITMATTILEAECRVLAAATVIETTPVGYQAQPNFLNGALLLYTSLDYRAFRRYLKDIEARLGRRRGPIKSGPRTIDLDIVLWDRRLVDSVAWQQDYVREPALEALERAGITLAPPALASCARQDGDTAK
ncbi:2-amino-4-hydroxy-6-hydroxymethyldihydropteridine diphosphokinase [Modicisalibacter tunisiensis]|uniref:2-amino-4-hydroxy-6-hydroxymethyldihydropteridine pyrophosphokinase n=1 Tax=Modicisalibacter tunisiensis TaxID=390637 RepID=A0ABS7X1C4_9GAMM|nr:2-amino-4-hydroxy-6-hydroxymethyldihydropteridine diphosphokinase [Modicisalibacter tunisiensis]MBZ9537883.1 2-amino-4-hydroxy-6-hydroxymethyldihydropteridine diphosphokinase [Modicisalibacter tunisiensis]MBZ9568700.1 2-amino-4-hydroxy-6-hydroxymethyldihydropteridine diphosphokinase [Modicisalibacter tunisiensis]